MYWVAWAVSLSVSRLCICQEDNGGQKVCWRRGSYRSSFLEKYRAAAPCVVPCELGWIPDLGLTWYCSKTSLFPIPTVLRSCQKVSRHTDIYAYFSASFRTVKSNEKNPAERLPLAFISSVYSQSAVSVVLHVTTLQRSRPDDYLTVVADSFTLYDVLLYEK